MIFALVLAFFFAGMFALVADLGALFIAYNRVDGGALLAMNHISYVDFILGGYAAQPSKRWARPPRVSASC